MSQIIDDPLEIICFCYGITRQEIVEAALQGADSIEKIREKTKANTGCGGCQNEVEALLEWVKKKSISKK
jgi:NAD(P)H-nitrite reductase large subunit